MSFHCDKCGAAITADQKRCPQCMAVIHEKVPDANSHAVDESQQADDEPEATPTAASLIAQARRAEVIEEAPTRPVETESVEAETPVADAPPQPLPLEEQSVLKAESDQPHVDQPHVNQPNVDQGSVTEQESGKAPLHAVTDNGDPHLGTETSENKPEVRETDRVVEAEVVTEADEVVDAVAVRSSSPFAPGYNLNAVNRPAGSKGTEPKKDFERIAAKGGAFGAITLGVMAIPGSLLSAASIITAVLGLMMGYWGLFSTHRKTALLGIVLCLTAIAVSVWITVNSPN